MYASVARCTIVSTAQSNEEISNVDDCWIKSDSTKRFAAYGFLKVDFTLETFRTNNKLDRDSFVKNVNVGDGNGSKSKTTNESTVTKNHSQTVPKADKAILKI